MKNTLGYAAKDAKSPLTLFNFQRRNPGPHDVEIDIHYCGICHSDIHQARDEWGGSIFPMVPGHEIIGRVTAVGAQVKSFQIGEQVGVGCFVDSCRDCQPCHDGLEQYCEKGMISTYNALEKDGVTPTYGGYSKHIVVDENYVLRIPESLPLHAAAPLLCAGITLYSPLRHWGVGPGSKVAIVGMGGLGHIGVKLASAMGAEVTVLSHSRRKEEDARAFGASAFYATSENNAFSKLQKSFDLIINTVSAEMDWNAYLGLLRLNGTMVMVGIPEKAIPVHSFPLVMGRRRLAGSLIGGIAETQEMLDFCGKHSIVCDVEMIKPQEVNEAYERVLRSDVRYRFVMDMAHLS